MRNTRAHVSVAMMYLNFNNKEEKHIIILHAIYKYMSHRQCPEWCRFYFAIDCLTESQQTLLVVLVSANTNS